MIIYSAKETIAIIFGLLIVVTGVYFIWQIILIGMLLGEIMIAIIGSIGAGSIVVISIQLIRNSIKK